jgi:hypothetical protein
LTAKIAPMREQYQAMVGNPARVEAILLAGAAKARELSRPFMAELRQAVGLRNLSAPSAVAQDKAAKDPPCQASSNTARRRQVLFQAGRRPAACCCCKARPLIPRASRAS